MSGIVPQKWPGRSRNLIELKDECGEGRALLRSAHVSVGMLGFYSIPVDFFEYFAPDTYDHEPCTEFDTLVDLKIMLRWLKGSPNTLDTGYETSSEK